MSIETDLYAFLSAQSPITDITTNIFPESDVEGVDGDYVSFALVDAEEERDFQSTLLAATYNIQIAANSGPSNLGADGTAQRAIDLAEAIRNSLAGLNGTLGTSTDVRVRMTDMSSDYDDGSRTHTQTMTFEILC